MNNSLKYISKVVGFIIRSFIALIFGSIALIAALMVFPIYLCTPSRMRYTEILEQYQESVYKNTL